MRKAWASKFDLLLIVALGLVLAPAVLLHVLLWSGHCLGMGLYDPALGGDPIWRHRPLILPVLVGVAAILRLTFSRGHWLSDSRPRRALTVLAVVAFVTAALSLIPEPSFLAN